MQRTGAGLQSLRPADTCSAREQDCNPCVQQTHARTNAGCNPCVQQTHAAHERRIVILASSRHMQRTGAGLQSLRPADTCSARAQDCNPCVQQTHAAHERRILICASTQCTEKKKKCLFKLKTFDITMSTYIS